jgi:hypothetical protein
MSGLTSTLVSQSPSVVKTVLSILTVHSHFNYVVSAISHIIISYYPRVLLERPPSCRKAKQAY